MLYAGSRTLKGHVAYLTWLARPNGNDPEILGFSSKKMKVKRRDHKDNNTEVDADKAIPKTARLYWFSAPVLDGMPFANIKDWLLKKPGSAPLPPPFPKGWTEVADGLPGNGSFWVVAVDPPV